MDRLCDLPLASVVSELAEATPAPGGGSAAACACALGAALVEMAAAIERRGESERMRILRKHALELAELDAALIQASAAPLAIAEAASEIAELGAGVAAAAGPAVRGDALTGVLLAEAAASAAAGLVEINLAQRQDAKELARAHQAAERAAAARSVALNSPG